MKINRRINEIPREHVGGEYGVSGDVLGWSGEAPNPPLGERSLSPLFLVVGRREK
jgi:hypothetical protein